MRTVRKVFGALAELVQVVPEQLSPEMLELVTGREGHMSHMAMVDSHFVALRDFVAMVWATYIF